MVQVIAMRHPIDLQIICFIPGVKQYLKIMELIKAKKI